MSNNKQYSEWYQVYDEIQKSVVKVHIVSEEKIVEDDEIKSKEFPLGMGSGFIFIIKDSVFIITANHVVSGLKQNHQIIIRAKKKDDSWKKIENPKVILRDEKRDIAVLRVKENPNEYESVIIPEHVFKRKYLKVGVDIVWCGYPSIGVILKPIFQKGMIAGYEEGLFEDDIAYIIDGIVNPGNSGGPAFYNYSKEVIGIVTRYGIQPSLYKLAVIDSEGKIHQFTVPSGLSLVIPLKHMIDLLLEET